MGKISFIIFTLNEEHRVAYAIRNFAPYGEVYVLDGGSTDRTKEITESLGAKFIIRPKNDKAYLETPEMFDFVKNLIKTEWVYWGYVDNFLPKTLLQRMCEVANDKNCAYVYLPVYTYLWGDTEHPIIKANYPSLFRPEYMDFTKNKIHGLGQFTGRPGQIFHMPNRLEYAMRHFSLYDLTKFIQAHLRYADAEARQKFSDGKRFSVFYMLGSMTRYFFLFFKNGFRSGIRGLYISLLYSSFRLMVAVRLYELGHNLTLTTIEDKFVLEKKKLLEEIEDK